MVKSIMVASIELVIRPSPHPFDRYGPKLVYWSFIENRVREFFLEGCHSEISREQLLVKSKQGVFDVPYILGLKRENILYSMLLLNCMLLQRL